MLGNHTRKILGGLAALSPLFLYPTELQAAEMLNKPFPDAIFSTIENKDIPVNAGEIDVFVRLTDQSVVEWRNNAVNQGQREPTAAEQQAYAELLAQKQNDVGNQLASLGATEMSRLRVGDNGLHVRIDASQLDSIKNIAGVSAVTKVIQYRPTLVKSVPWIGASAVQNAGNDGSGTTIAIIDTGIDYLHANFGGSGDPADYASNDKNIIEAGTFPTAKVIGGFDLAGATYDASVPGSMPVPDPDPLDGNGHGSHVGGIAAGLGVPGEVGIGVAPGASILALKVFGDVAGSTALVSSAIEIALDPNGDGDISDHVDVINMSLGSDYGSPDDPSAVAAHNAANLGIVVVASAGNAGNIPYITGSPAVAPNVVSVASSLSGGDTTGIDVDGTAYEAVEGTGAVRIADGVVTGNLAQPSDPANVFGCAPITDDMTGKVVLISRGACSFDTKYVNVQSAGGVAIVVYNDGASPNRVAPIIMGGIGSSGTPITIPGTMIASFDGYALAAALGGTPLLATLDESITAQTSFGDTLSGFSSRGPGHGQSQFKPDLSAPGQSIVSTRVGSGTAALTLSGTSMASPHVAGVSALLVAANPDVTPAGIKALLQNSTVSAVGDGLVGIPPLSRQGTGVVRADSAVSLTSYATPGGVSFGRVNPSHEEKYEVEVELVNLASESRTFSVTHVPNQSFPGVVVNCPETVSIDAAGKSDKSKKSKKGKKSDKDKGKSSKSSVKSEKFEIELVMNPAVGPFDDAFQSQTEVDGWCVLDDGVDQLRVGYMAVVDPASKMEASVNAGVLTISNEEGNVGWAEGFTLAGEDGLLLDDQFNAFQAIGYRSNSFAAFGDLIQFGIASERAWETFATAEIDIFIDVDKDGIDDAILVVADFFDDGIPVTAIFPQGAALFDAGVDYNDSTAILTFIARIDSPFGFLGFLPPGDTDFDYTAVFFDIRTGDFDVQFGSVDMASEITPSSATFGLFPNTSVELGTTGSGDMLWLYQNNEAEDGEGDDQAEIVTVVGGTLSI